jgi:hypothetical protein
VTVAVAVGTEVAKGIVGTEVASGVSVGAVQALAVTRTSNVTNAICKTELDRSFILISLYAKPLVAMEERFASAARRSVAEAYVGIPRACMISFHLDRV